jgi:hypothetical protein
MNPALPIQILIIPRNCFVNEQRFLLVVITSIVATDCPNTSFASSSLHYTHSIRTLC